MAKVGVVSDVESYLTKVALLEFLRDLNWEPVDLGVDSDLDITSHEALGERIIDGVTDNSFPCAIGLSHTGNSIQMFANKSRVIRAAAMWDQKYVEEDVKIHRLNVCDIYSRISIEKVCAIAQTFLKSFVEVEEAGRLK